MKNGKEENQRTSWRSNIGMPVRETRENKVYKTNFMKKEISQN